MEGGDDPRVRGRVFASSVVVSATWRGRAAHMNPPPWSQSSHGPLGFGAGKIRSGMSTPCAVLYILSRCGSGHVGRGLGIVLLLMLGKWTTIATYMLDRPEQFRRICGARDNRGCDATGRCTTRYPSRAPIIHDTCILQTARETERDTRHCSILPQRSTISQPHHGPRTTPPRRTILRSALRPTPSPPPPPRLPEHSIHRIHDHSMWLLVALCLHLRRPTLMACQCRSRR